MRSLLFLSSALTLSAIAALGCSSRDIEPEGDEAPVSAADLALARRVVKLFSGAEARCNRCHTSSKEDVIRWGTAAKAVEDNCLAPSLNLSKEERIACLSDDPESTFQMFSAGKLGLYSTGVNLAGFRDLFDADGAGAGNHQLFARQTLMPRGSVPALTENEFADLKKWVVAGMPALDEALQDPELGPCQTRITPALKEYLGQAKGDGWNARHIEASTTMFGCGEATDPLECLTEFPDVSEAWGAEGVPQTLRSIRSFNRRSNWQVRGSADGRYIGFGYNNSARIYDLTRGATDAGISVRANYDPVFFPSNDGFSYSGNAGIRVCKWNVLENATTQITLNETGCSFIQNNVYQTIGSAIDGSVYWMSTGTHVNDDGAWASNPPTGLPAFDGAAKTYLVPMVSDGVKYNPGERVTLDLPFEGDQQLSPSSRLLVTRFGNKVGKSGFRFRKLSWGPAVSGSGLSVNTEDLGQICVRGTKPASSFDERFVLTHQYVDPADTPDLPRGSANLILMDLLTGEATRITTMRAGQFAFSAHFRADGWIYFVVRDRNSSTTPETWVASDAALRRLAASPTP